MSVNALHAPHRTHPARQSEARRPAALTISATVSYTSLTSATRGGNHDSIGGTFIGLSGTSIGKTPFLKTCTSTPHALIDASQVFAPRNREVLHRLGVRLSSPADPRETSTGLGIGCRISGNGRFFHRRPGHEPALVFGRSHHRCYFQLNGKGGLMARPSVEKT